MRKSITGILIGLMFLVAMVAGASTSALEIHALNVKPFNEANTPAPDAIKVTGTETHTWTNYSTIRR